MSFFIHSNDDDNDKDDDSRFNITMPIGIVIF